MSVIDQRHAARRDLVEIVAYLAERSEGAARRFRVEAEATFTRLAGMPGMGTRYEPDEPAYAELRYFPVSRFPRYLVFYRSLPDGIEVVRVLHGSRDIAGMLADDFGIQDDEGEAAV
jgi:toxin ParE1/3/4